MNIRNPFITIAHFDLVRLSTESKPTNVKDGSTCFEVDTSNLYVFYKGTWYLQGEQEEQTEETQDVSSVQNAPLNNVISIPKELGKIEPVEEIIESVEEIIEPVEETEDIEEIQEDTEEVEEGEE